MLGGWQKDSRVTNRVGVGKEAVIVGDIDYMAKLMVVGNLNCLIEVIPNENL